MSHSKRPFEESLDPPPLSSSSSKKPLLSSAPLQSLAEEQKRPTFISYLEVPNLPPKTKLLCEILSNTASASLESSLSDTGVRVSTDDVEEVLKLSYSSPAAAVKFFRWAGQQLGRSHSPYAWNLVVDLLGKNLLFDAMWDAIKSMRGERLVSLATFASVFSSYASAGRIDEALMTFEVMDQYGCPHDVVALNSLISAICRCGQTLKAWEFYLRAKDKIRPDADTFAILLEGWENDGAIIHARQTFTEMVASVGWDPANVPAYDSFLNTLLKAPNGDLEAMRFFDAMKEKHCYPGMKFFRSALDEFLKTSNHRAASVLWEEMVDRNRCRPDTHMYNSMITLQCYHNRPEYAQMFLDGMVFNGAFPDTETYNVMLQFMIKNRRLHEMAVIFKEMVKNECLPTHANCTSAIRVSLDLRDPDLAIRVWKCMVENDIVPLEDSANLLVVELPHSYRLAEAVKYAEDMIERGIKLNSSTLSKLKHSLTKAGKGNIYEQILRKWKSH